MGEPMNSEEVRKIAKEELQILQQVKDGEEKIKKLEAQVLVMVDSSKIKEKESQIASLEKQIGETKDTLKKQGEHPFMAESLLACPECHQKLAGKLIEKIFKENPEKLRKLVCDFTGCRWVFTDKEEAGSDTDIVDALLGPKGEEGGFTLGIGKGGENG